LLQESSTSARKFFVEPFLLDHIPRLRNDRGAYWKFEIAEVQFKLFLALDRRLHVLELVMHPNYIFVGQRQKKIVFVRKIRSLRLISVQLSIRAEQITSEDVADLLHQAKRRVTIPLTRRQVL
jgi:hypothetical protein